MWAIAIITVSVLFSFPLNIAEDAASEQRVEHHGQIVDNNGAPNDCIVCHDGLIGPYARYCTVDCGFATPHSVNKKYPPISKEDSYASIESLREKGIRLFDGKVSCISCHDLRVLTKNHLIVDNSGSALCFSCHHI